MENTSRTDADLIASILSSSPNDFKILMERYQQRIFAYLFRFLYQDEQAALDITQEVFIKVYEKLGTVDTNRPLQPWIYRVAHNQAANYLRTVSRRKESYLLDQHWDKISGDEGWDSLEAEEERLHVLGALDLIDSKYREVLVLYYFEERSYKEIAEIINTSTNTVGTFIARGKKQLKKQLDGKILQSSLLLQLVFGCLFVTTIFGILINEPGDRQ